MGQYKAGTVKVLIMKTDGAHEAGTIVEVGKNSVSDFLRKHNGVDLRGKPQATIDELVRKAKGETKPAAASAKVAKPYEGLVLEFKRAVQYVSRLRNPVTREDIAEQLVAINFNVSAKDVYFKPVEQYTPGGYRSLDRKTYSPESLWDLGEYEVGVKFTSNPDPTPVTVRLMNLKGEMKSRAEENEEYTGRTDWYSRSPRF